MKKTLSVLIAAILILSSLSLLSCSNKDKLNRTVVGNVNGYEVYYEELRWLTMQYKDLIEATYGEGLWDNPELAEKHRAELEDAVFSSIISNYAVLTLCDEFSANGEKLIDINGGDVPGLVDDYVKDTVNELGGRSEYRKSLEKNYLTDSLYRFITGVDICESILFKYYCELTYIDDSDEAALDYIFENFIRTKHIYIQNDAKDNVSENRALADAVRVKLMNGEDLDTLIKNYSEDGYMSTENGYYFTHGQYSEAYEAASFALAIDEVSPVVETYSGYYIIKRLELDTEYVMSNLYSGLKDQYFVAVFDKFIDEQKATLKFVPNEYGSSLDLTKMK